LDNEENLRGEPRSPQKEYTITLDDDPMVPRMIQKALGIKSIPFVSPEQLLATAEKYHPVAAFIDIHLGVDTTGLGVIPALRQRWPFCPILVVTSDPTDEAVTEALASGADDFLRKPIRPKELNARLQTRLIDQAQKEARNVIVFADVSLDQAYRTLRGPSGERYLSPTETNLFLALVQARGTTVPRSTLKTRCWDQIAVSNNALDRKIYELRRALAEVGSRLNIGTAYGVGFSLDFETPTNPTAATEPSGEAKVINAAPTVREGIR
jgi:DNA-binding response OmpR family regulator